jgi:hypothetical protein
VRWRLVLLPPEDAAMPSCFGRISPDNKRYTELLHGMQRLRGRVYVEDGALQTSQLTPDGRHILSSDASSWHLLMCQNNEVSGCMRYSVHYGSVPFHALGVAEAAPAQCEERSSAVRSAVEREIKKASLLGLGFGEAGGWALDRELRGSTAALRLVLSTYSLAQLLGDAIVLSTATLRNGSATILCRIGGEPLNLDTGELEDYYDPKYNCQMRLLRFDSRIPNPKYREGIQQHRIQLLNSTVVCPSQFVTAAAA